MATYKIARLILLLFIFTIVEVVTFGVWTMYLNDVQNGSIVLLVGLTIEHAISLVTGYLAGIWFPARKGVIQ